MLRSNESGRPLALGLGLIAVVGAIAAFLVSRGNPGNMGICGACFLRDVAGSLGLFGKGPQVFRPEVIGLILGALGFRLVRGRFEARSGSHAVTRFVFGLWMGIGSLVFLGCPFRMFQRLGGGDLNAAVGVVGLIVGTGVGLWFETRRNYRVGRTEVVAPAIGLLGPAMFGLVFLLFLSSQMLLGPGPGDVTGPAHAPWMLSIGLALVAGAILSATGFCGISAARQVFQRGKKRMLVAAGVLVVSYGLIAALTGTFHFGFEGQPIAHQDHLWNVLSLALVGLCGVLAGGCPVRQIVMCGEGNGDAFVTTMGLVVGGALSHTLGLASSGLGPTPAGQLA
ncbi:MAG: YedE-related selenium metabolism membrane protein, partial [Planctomycetes bacterium]|nr:YedE-related selenium metabolism membrane protein [Planctomycetota bacterium]